MEFQDNLLQERNLSGLMEMELVLKNLTHMVISLLGVQVKEISIRKLNSLGFNQIIKEIKNH